MVLQGLMWVCSGILSNQRGMGGGGPPLEKFLKFQHSESTSHGVLELKSVITTHTLTGS